MYSNILKLIFHLIYRLNVRARKGLVRGFKLSLVRFTDFTKETSGHDADIY